jgi:hypothetical protein
MESVHLFEIDAGVRLLSPLLHARIITDKTSPQNSKVKEIGSPFMILKKYLQVIIWQKFGYRLSSFCFQGQNTYVLKNK